jgi:hypothetical protein
VGSRHGEMVNAARALTSRQGKASAIRAPRAMPELVCAVEDETLPPFLKYAKDGGAKKRTDIKSIMILGAGPIVIGQVRPP